jgi:hypothetical protein
VLRELRDTDVRDGILGTFRLDERGEISPARVTIVRVTGSTRPGEELNPGYEGGVVDRIMRVPPALAG